MRQRGLIAAGAPQVAIAMDFAVWAVAAPSVRATLNLSPSELGWVFSAYSLAFGSLILVAGRFVDAIGFRPALRVGAVAYAVACGAEACATQWTVLIGARVAQGVGAALMAPAALAAMAAAQPAPTTGRRPMSAYGAAIAGGFAAGSLVAAIVVPLAGWRWSLLPGALAASLGALALPRGAGGRPASSATPTRPPLVGPLLVGGAAAIVVLSLGQAASHPVRCGAAIASAAVALAFMARNRSGILGDRRLIATTAGPLVLTTTGTAGVLLVSIRLQDGYGWATLPAGAALAAFGLMTWPASRAHRALTRRLDPSKSVAAGLALEGCALAALAIAEGSAPALVAAVAALGFSHVVANAAVAAGAVAGPAGRRGERAGVVTAAEYLGGAIGPVAIGAVPAATAGGYVTGMAGASVAAIAGSLLLLRAGAPGERVARGPDSSRRERPA